MFFFRLPLFGPLPLLAAGELILGLAPKLETEVPGAGAEAGVPKGVTPNTKGFDAGAVAVAVAGAV